MNEEWKSPGALQRGSFFGLLSTPEILITSFLFICLALGYFWEMVGSDPILAGGDNLFFFIPLRQFWVEAARNFSFPLWNPLSLTGTPLFATLQPAVLYPFSLFYLFLPFYLVFNLTIILHYALAGFFMYWLMRGQRCSITAAAVSGLTFMLSGYLLSIHHYLSTLLPVAWVPLLLLCYFAGFLKNDRRYTLLAGGVGGVMLFAGGVETCYQIFPWMILFTLFPQMLFAEESCPAWQKRLSHLLVFFGVWAGLSAVQLLPTFELSQWSTRRHGLATWEAKIWSLNLKDIPMFFTLDLYGYFSDGKTFWSNQNWLKTLYLGAIPFLTFGYYLHKGSTRAYSLLLVTVLSLALALGSNTLLFPFLREYIPFFDSFRYPVKFIFPAVLALSIGAGLGFERFKRDIQSASAETVTWSRKLLILAVCLVLAFAFMSFFNDFWVQWFTENGLAPPLFNQVWVNLGNLKRLLAFTSIFCLLWFLYANVSRGRQWFLHASVLLLALDLFFGNHGLYFKISAKRYNRPSANMEYLLADPGLFRVYVTPETQKDYFNRKVRENKMNFKTMVSMIFPQIGISHGINYAGGFIVMRPFWFENIQVLLKSLPPERRIPLLSMLNTKYIVSIDKLDSKNLTLASEEDVEGETEETIKVYENHNVLPRAYLVNSCRQISSEKDYPDTFVGKDFQPGEMILLEKSPEELPCAQGTPSSLPNDDTVLFSETNNNSQALTVSLDSKKFLFLSEAWFPGWEATVDGKPTKIYRANFAFRAILLEPGTHQVRFDYKPMSFKVGMVISLATLLACMIIWRKTGNERQPK